AVIGASIDRLMQLDYPPESLRVYVVDDASTDDTPDVIKAKAARYPGQVVHLRREQGGQGKSHTLNHGLRIILADDWMQALLIMDADVIYEPDSLRTMTRHLADPGVGAVTAYIKEGSRPGNYLTRFIGFEYITAQAAARRSQNVLGAVACLAGGAQLHSRANLEAIGGRVDTSSLAEDTFTTFKTQLAGNRVVFEPHATVWAEEPGDIRGLWKQRLRWARGNVQVTRQFSHVWCRASPDHRLGSISFSVFWFCLFLLPVFMIAASASLIILYFGDFQLAWVVFHVLWIVNALTYVFITSFVLMIDWVTGRHAWVEGVLFPGLISVSIIIAACFPRLLQMILHDVLPLMGITLTFAERRALVLFAYAWLAGSMLVAYLGKAVETRRFGRVLSPAFIYIAGYGPLLCACTFVSYIKELRGAEMTWDKTEKTGKVAMPV
ncbi:MAG TPA: glycosyltransferase family 2 protein, partial [Streptosporangiaceae bacterium]|nr:glycosyltransferase family 2 protein [Streptosporangiaceae bacterium]